jgi:hypothetical protein
MQIGSMNKCPGVLRVPGLHSSRIFATCSLPFLLVIHAAHQAALFAMFVFYGA